MDSGSVIKLLTNQAAAILPTGSKLILFGSRARGSAHENSDWDILVVLNKAHRSVKDIDDYGLPFRELGWEIDQEINPIISTYQEIQDKSKSTLLYKNITKDGIILWE